MVSSVVFRRCNVFVVSGSRAGGRVFVYICYEHAMEFEYNRVQGLHKTQAGACNIGIECSV